MLDWIEEHPYLTGGVILGAIVLWVIIRNRSNAAAASAASNAGTVVSGPSDALQEAELAAGVQTQTAQLAVQAQIAQNNSNVNAVQLEAAAQTTLGGLSAGVQDDQTAAQLQLGLAQFGYSPSNSPFGITVPVGGSAATAPVVKPAAAVPATVAGIGTAAAASATQAAAENNLMALATTLPPSPPDAASLAFTGITPATTGAGSGNPVNVPSVPVYIAGPGGPVDIGQTAPLIIPSSSGMTYNQYWQDVSSHFNTQSLAPMSVAQLTAAQTAAEEDYLTNPNSCHNRVC